MGRLPGNQPSLHPTRRAHEELFISDCIEVIYEVEFAAEGR